VAPGGEPIDVEVGWSPALLPPQGLNMSLSPPAEPFGAAGSIRVWSAATAAVPALADVAFPIMWLRAGLPMSADNTTLVWSREAGRSWRNPWDADEGYLCGTSTNVGTPVSRLPVPCDTLDAPYPCPVHPSARF